LILTFCTSSQPARIGSGLICQHVATVGQVRMSVVGPLVPKMAKQLASAAGAPCCPEAGYFFLKIFFLSFFHSFFVG